MITTTTHPMSLVSPELLQQMDLNGPRYTSYPTADRFVEAFGEHDYIQALEQRRTGPAYSGPLSLYVHIPFCESLCYYCACNKIITKDRNRGIPYVDDLARELQLLAPHLGHDRRLAQLHFGGGTPTFLEADSLSRLMATLREHFQFTPDGEYSIEIDPRTTPPEVVAHLASLGFNRASLGVQDFDPEVQRAVHRTQPAEMTLLTLAAAREHGFRSINFDLIYGLPKQTVASFSRTLEQVLEARPDRIALYNNAHLPERFKPQRRIAATELPDGETRLQIFLTAARMLGEAGYVYIGLDHFARPDDELAHAQRTGRLHRNFQGYSTRADCDLLALGVSAISRIGASYSQNVRTLEEYRAALAEDRVPVMRGMSLTRDDLIRRAVIMSLMSHGEVSLDSIEIAYLIDFRTYFADELESLKEYMDLGLVGLDDGWLTVTPKGRLFVRVVCMAFDRYLTRTETRAQYSRVI